MATNAQLAGPKSRLIPLVLLLVAAAFRLPGVDTAPPALYQDEASRGYDAWCLLETGADRHGHRWPMFLESFGQGDWTAALTTYLTISFVALLGPGEWAIRLPDAILGVLTVLLLYEFLKRWLSMEAALAGALVFAVDPWHISLCRTGHESGFAPFFLMAGLLAMLRSGLMAEDATDEGETGVPSGNSPTSTDSSSHRADRTTRVAYAFLAGVMFALHTWVYPATRFFTPLFLLAMLLIYRQWWLGPGSSRGRRTRLKAAAVGLVIGAAPIWMTALSHPERLAARARVTIFAQEGFTTVQRLTMFANNYLSNLSPRYNFLRFDELSGTEIHGVGLHLLVTAPLLAVGLMQLVIGCRASRWNRMLVAWLILFPLPAAICADWNPHSFRTVGGMLWYPMIIALGWQWLRRRLRALPPRRWMLFHVGAVSALALNAAYFADVYFRRMPPIMEPAYQTPLVRAIQFAGKHVEEAEFVLVTRWFNQPYIYALLYAPVPPNELAGLPTIAGPDLLGFHQVNRIGKFFFPPREADKTPELTAAFQEAFSALPPEAEGLVIELAGRFGGGEVLATFPVGYGDRAGPPLEVRWWRRSDDPTPKTPTSHTRSVEPVEPGAK